MSFLDRMKQPVETIGVGRYLFEKVAHVATFTLLAILAFPGYAWWITSALLGLAYTLFGKLMWLLEHSTFDLADAIFDLVVVLLVPIAVYAFTRDVVIAGIVLAAWATLVLVGSNNRWGSPS